jgi:hypothetical protein
VKGKLLVRGPLLCCVFLLVSGARIDAFPTEDDVKSKLRPGMTVEEVVTVLGEPSNGRVPDCQKCSLQYIAPINRLDVPKEGYIGVVVHFDDGKVHDWRIYTGNPSYNPSLKMPSVFKWELWLIGGLLAIALAIRFLLRIMPAGFMVYNDALAAYAARDIPLRRLPSEFRFITHDTTLQEVIAKVGPYSREVKLPVDPSSVGGYGFIETPQGGAAILTFEYDLPYSAAVIIMPEYPFEPSNRIRAVFYRPLNAELADATGR